MNKEPRTYYVEKDHQKKLEKLAKEKTKATGIPTAISNVVCMIFDKFFKSK